MGSQLAIYGHMLWSYMGSWLVIYGLGTRLRRPSTPLFDYRNGDPVPRPLERSGRELTRDPVKITTVLILVKPPTAFNEAEVGFRQDGVAL